MAASKESKPATPAAVEERAPTQRVVLQQQQVLILPESLSAEDVQAILKAVQDSKKMGTPSKALATGWVVVGEFEGASKEDAIEAHTGPAGAPDTKVGTFKAPTVKAFAGGMRMVAPPKPLVQKEAID